MRRSPSELMWHLRSLTKVWWANVRMVTDNLPGISQHWWTLLPHHQKSFKDTRISQFYSLLWGSCRARPEGGLELLVGQLPHHGVQLLLLLLAYQWSDVTSDASYRHSYHQGNSPHLHLPTPFCQFKLFCNKSKVQRFVWMLSTISSLLRN